MLCLSISTPGFPHFYYILGANLGSLWYTDASVMFQLKLCEDFVKKNPRCYCKTSVKFQISLVLSLVEIKGFDILTLRLWKKLTWGLTYFDQFKYKCEKLACQHAIVERQDIIWASSLDYGTCTYHIGDQWRLRRRRRVRKKNLDICIWYHRTMYPKINFQSIRICLTHMQICRMIVGHVSFHWT